MAVINDSMKIVRTFANEFRARGLKEATKPLGGYESVRARVVKEEQYMLGAKKVKPNSIIYDVERTAPHKVDETFPSVVARDTYVSSATGKPKLAVSQLMSETGDAYIVPGKKGFLGIGRKKAQFRVSQSTDRVEYFQHDPTAENMCLTALGTLDKPVNPVLHVNGNALVLTLEKAKQFINDVLKGEKAYGFQYNRR